MKLLLKQKWFLVVPGNLRGFKHFTCDTDMNEAELLFV